MAESMLAILCHILRGEPLIRERLGREREGSRGEEETGGEEGGPRREPQVNQQQLQQVGTGEQWVGGVLVISRFLFVLPNLFLCFSKVLLFFPRYSSEFS